MLTSLSLRSSSRTSIRLYFDETCSVNYTESVGTTAMRRLGTRRVYGANFARNQCSSYLQLGESGQLPCRSSSDLRGFSLVDFSCDQFHAPWGPPKIHTFSETPNCGHKSGAPSLLLFYLQLITACPILTTKRRSRPRMVSVCIAYLEKPSQMD